MALTSDTFAQMLPHARMSTKSAFNAMSWSASNTNYIADANDKPIAVKGIMVTVAGNLNLVFMDQPEASAIVVPVSANVLYPFSVKMIKSTSTTATGIIVFW